MSPTLFAAAAPRPFARLRRAAGALTAALVATTALGTIVAPPAEARPIDRLLDARVAATAEVALDALVKGNAVQLNLGRSILAGLVAGEGSVDADALERAWGTAGEPRQVVVFSALAQVGRPYRSTGDEPSTGFDCSGLTKYAWSAAGLTLDHNDATQINEAAVIPAVDAHPGDLAQWPGHVMLYLGVDDLIVHAANTGVPIQVGKIGSRSVRFADPLGR